MKYLSETTTQSNYPIIVLLKKWSNNYYLWIKCLIVNNLNWLFKLINLIQIISY